MVSQVRSFLEEYGESGGTYERFLVEGAGHTPFVEKPGEFARRLADFLYG